MSLQERVVEIEVSLGTESAERYRYGSGFRLGRRFVLTAAHVVAENPVAGITVRGPDKVPHPARVVDGLVGDPDEVDLALLELCDEIAELPPPLVAAVERNVPVPAPVEGCWAVGYPLFQEVESPAGVVRETAQMWGIILPGENLVSGLLTLQVTSSPRSLPPQQEALGESQWSGMSGAAVLVGERLVGVVCEHAPRRGESTITVTPLDRLSRLPAEIAAQWWEYLDADPEHLVMLPVRRRRPEPEYRAALRRLRARTVLQDRGKELAEIGAFATGRPSALAPPGSQHAWLVAGPWAGKTALLAEAVHALPAEVDCVAYFLTRPTGDADRERFLAAVVPQLVWLLGTDLPSVMNEYVFWQLWEQAAQHAAETGRHLLLIVDGLDEDLQPGGRSVAGCLPGRLPDMPARVLVTSRPYPQSPDLYPMLPIDVDPAFPLATFKPDQLYALSGSSPATRLRNLAEREITQLLRRADGDLVLEVLGFLTAARGPLSVADLTWLTGSPPWKVRGIIEGEAARTLRQDGPEDTPRYSFAHETLLDRCQQEGVSNPDHTLRIHEWAARWRGRSWPTAHGGEDATPLYLLDTYPHTLYDDPPRLAALAGDISWVTTTIQALGVDAVLADLITANAAAPGEPRLAAMHAVLRGQAHHLRSPDAADDPGFVPRQMCLQAAELGETRLADDCRTRQLASGNPGPVLQWTTRRASPALILDLGHVAAGVGAMAVLPDGRVVTGSRLADLGRGVLVWNPDKPGAAPVELDRHGRGVSAVAVLPDGRVVTGSLRDGRVQVWNPDKPGGGPVELGGDEVYGVSAMAVLPNGRVVTGSTGVRDGSGRLLVWDPSKPGSPPVELGREKYGVSAVAVLPDGRVVTGSRRGGGVQVWDPDKPGNPPVGLDRRGRAVSTIAVLPDGRVVTGSGEGANVLAWDPSRPGTGPVELGHDEDGVSYVSAVAVLPDGRVVTGGGHPDVGGRGGRVLIWDSHTPGARPLELGRDEYGVSAVVVLQDGRVVTGSGFQGRRGGRVRIWDSRRPGGQVKDGRDEDPVKVVAALPDGRVVTGSGYPGFGGRLLVWDPSKPDTDPVELDRKAREVWAVAVLPDGRVVTGSKGIGYGVNCGVLVWDPNRPGTDPIELGRDKNTVRAVAVLPDGRVVTGSGNGPGQGGGLLVWDPDRPGIPSVELGRCEGGVEVVAVLPDGRVVAGSRYPTRGERLLVWDPDRPGARPVKLGRDEDGVSAVAVLPDGRVVTSSGFSGTGLLVSDPDKPRARPIELGRDEDGVSAVAVLPDGRVVTSSDRSGWVRLWFMQEERSPGTLLMCSVNALATSFSPSGARLFISHVPRGFSCWEVRLATQNAPVPP